MFYYIARINPISIHFEIALDINFATAAIQEHTQAASRVYKTSFIHSHEKYQVIQ